MKSFSIFSSVVMDNFKNAPKHLYGLTPAQMDMFMTEDNPVRRQSESVTEVYSLHIVLILPKLLYVWILEVLFLFLS